MFARRALVARAWEAILDPQGEAEAVSPLTEQQAWQIILEDQARGRAPVDNSELLRRIGMPPDKRDARLRCPAHGEGKKLTLHVTITEDGVLMHCFAGCTFEEIRRSVGL